MSHSGHLLVTQFSLGQVCPGDSGLYALLKCERNQLPSENRQVDGHGWRGGKIRNAMKSQSVWPCVDWSNIDMEWEQDLCLTTHYMHSFSEKCNGSYLRWAHHFLAVSVMIQPAVFWKVIFPSVVDFFLLLGKVVATKISTLSRVKSLKQNPLDMKKEVAFNDFWSNVDLIITTATCIFFDVGVQDPLVAPRGSPQY